MRDIFRGRICLDRRPPYLLMPDFWTNIVLIFLLSGVVDVGDVR